MGLRHWSYVAMLAFCLAGTLPLARVYRLTVFRRPLRLLAAIVLAAAPFVVWDLWATHAGHWHFDPAQTLPPRVLGVPLEELGFFVVIPLASILAHQGVRVVRGEAGAAGARPGERRRASADGASPGESGAGSPR